VLRRLLLVAVLVAVAAPGAAGADASTDLSVKAFVTSSRTHVGEGVDVTVQIVNGGTADVPNVHWTAALTPNLDPWNSPTAGSTGAVAGSGQAVVYLSAAIVHRGPAAIRIAISADGISDPDSSNDVATVRFTALPPKHAFTELRDPVPAPAGTRVAFVRRTTYGTRTPSIGPWTFGRVFVTNGAQSVAVTPLQRVQTGVAWAPDGRTLAYASRGRIWTVDLSSHRVHRLTSGGPAEDRWPVWSPDGTKIAYVTGDRYGLEVAAVIPASGGVAPTVVAFTGSQVGWSPDGRYVVADGSLWDAAGSMQSSSTGDVEWARDGNRVLRHDASGALTVADAATGTVVATLPDRPLLVRPHLSPHGDTVAAATVRGRVALVNVTTRRIHYAPHAASSDDSARWLTSSLVAYVGSGRCGPRTEIDVARRDGGGARSVARTCA
jgi:dipeptidyl aminopeptidase/acylaminoacyl peptidase